MTTPKQPKLTPPAAVALADAGALIRRRLAAWPDTFSLAELAALLGGGERTPDCQRWKVRLVAALDLGQLAPGCPPVVRDALPLPPPDLAHEWLGIDGEIARARAAVIASAVRTAAARISRDAAAAWLRAIGETPPAVVEAWLGDTWTNAAKTKADKTPEPWIAEARRIGEKWVKEYLRENEDPPRQEDVAQYCEDELARREILSARGQYLRKDYIRKLALRGITGQPRGHNRRRTPR